MASVTLNITQFRTRFPAYANETTYPDATIQATWDTAVIYIGNVTDDCLSEDQLELALEQMTAHLLFIQDKLSSGATQTGTVTSSSIDKVSVTIAAPKNDDEWEYWLNQSPYGQQLLALLNTICVGGFYIGGNAPRTAYLP
jgi:hypothetical protein